MYNGVLGTVNEKSIARIREKKRENDSYLDDPFDRRRREVRVCVYACVSVRVCRSLNAMITAMT